MKARDSWLRAWILPMVTLGSLAFFGFLGAYAIDAYGTGGPASDAPGHGVLRYLFFDQDHITDAVSSLGGMVAGVLGIVISVVSIVVQLSAERYTGVARMFFEDRTNITVLGFYIVVCVSGVWVSVSLRGDFVPRVTLLAMMLTTTTCLVLMAPYFTYVFRFLEPTHIVRRIRENALGVVREGATTQADAVRAAAQARTIAAMEELTDIASNSIQGKDKIIASRAVDALKDFALHYVEVKRSATDAWFAIGESIRDNPDFVAMDPESLDDLVAHRTWVEWKVLRQYLGIYNEALSAMRDIDYLIAIDTRYIGEGAARAGDHAVVALVLRYMNSYLRVTLNARDVRTAYNVLNQYRLLAESLLRGGHTREALLAVSHMRYYAHVGYDLALPFVTETVAYDIGALCELASELAIPEETTILRELLELDRPSAERAEEQALKGVRKAQVKLAAYHLAAGNAEPARRIMDDLASEPDERLRAIREELERVETKEFWEITDRGRNFEYMPPAQKVAMRRFFDELALRRA